MCIECETKFNEVLNLNKNLYFSFKTISNNEMTFYLNNEFENIENKFYKYNENINILLSKYVDVKLDNKKFDKITQTQIKLLTKTNNNISNILFSKNNFYKIIKKKKELLKLTKKSEKTILILNNMVNSYSDYKYNINYNKFKNVNYKDLQIGDIILTIKSDRIINNRFMNKLIFLLTKSHIIHSTIYFKEEKHKYIFLDVPKVHYFGKSKYKKYRKNYSKGEIGLILRTKKNLTKKQKTSFYNNLNEKIGSTYGTYKALFLAAKLEYDEITPWHANIKNKNRYIKNSSYCSENVVRLYEQIGIYLGNKQDEGTVTPVDLLNTEQLKIVGYINHSQKQEKKETLKSNKNKVKNKN